MSDDYFSYLQSQLAALQDDPRPPGEEPPVTVMAAPPVPTELAAPAGNYSPVAPPVQVRAPEPVQVRPPQPTPQQVDPWLPPPPHQPPSQPQPIAAPVDPSRPVAAPVVAAPVVTAPIVPAPVMAAPVLTAPAPPETTAPSRYYQRPPEVDPWLPPPRQAVSAPPAPAPDPRKSRHVGRWIALGVVAGLLILASAVGAFTRVVSRLRPAHPKNWDARVIDIVKFDEQERGLTFKHPVAVDFMTPTAFKAKVGGGKISASDAKELEHTVAQARALGLLHGKVDLGSLEKQMAEEEVIGLYDPGSGRIYVRGDVLTPAVRVTLAHELTHALQDQYFNLKRRPDPQADSAAERALVEGDAVRVEREFIKSKLSAADRTAYEDESRRESDQANVTGLPEALTAGFAFPYIYGPDFVEALVAKGGNAAVDSAMRNPPKTDAEIIDPDRYFAGIRPEFPKPPTLQTGDHRLQKPAAFGEFSALEVLGDRVGFVRAWQSLAGWRGDTIVPFSRAKRDCVALVTQFDTADHASAFAGVANQWVDVASDGAVLQQGASVQLEACDPGANHESPPAVTPSALDVLQARAAVINSLASQPGADRGLARCAIDKAIAGLGAQQFMDVLQSNTLSPAARQAVASGAAACRESGG